MDFEFGEEHKMLREAIRDFAEKKIVPLVDEAEEKERFPKELFPRMGKLGYLCVSHPAEYGAGGMGMIGLHEMLMQTHDEKIRLFQAWSKDWDVDFKLHAPCQTTVECAFRNGKIETLKVTPEERRKDLVV